MERSPIELTSVAAQISNASITGEPICTKDLVDVVKFLAASISRHNGFKMSHKDASGKKVLFAFGTAERRVAILIMLGVLAENGAFPTFITNTGAVGSISSALRKIISLTAKDVLLSENEDTTH